MEVQPAFYGGLLSWQLGIADERVLTYAQSIERFYSEFEPDDEITFKPLANVLDPTQGGVPLYPYYRVRLLLYRRNFRVLIIKHISLMSGPHAARLCYHSQYDNQVHWLATLQIKANFYDEDSVSKELNEGIKSKKFYISPKSESDTLVL